MLEKIHFISGLPRSGSTLLSAILRQNPAICCGDEQSSGRHAIDGAIQKMSGGEFNGFYDDATRAAMLRGLFENYYGQERCRILAPRSVVFDTNRAWTGRVAVLADFVSRFAHHLLRA